MNWLILTRKILAIFGFFTETIDMFLETKKALENFQCLGIFLGFLGSYP